MKKIKQSDLHSRPCPVCQGTGTLYSRRIVRYPDDIRTAARKMFRAGKSLREIGKAIGMEKVHPQKVMSLILAKTK
jgi:hypothetical protein